MSTYTEHYKLVKPSYDEDIDIQVINNNMDAIDNTINGLDFVQNAFTNDSGLHLNKRDGSIIDVPLNYLPVTGGNITGDLTVQNKHPVYLLEKKTQDFEKYSLSALKYSDGTLKQEIRYKHETAGTISSIDVITFLIPFINVDNITLSTGCYSTIEGDEPYNDWVWSVANLTATGCKTKASSYYSAPCYVINGFWK